MTAFERYVFHRLKAEIHRELAKRSLKETPSEDREDAYKRVHELWQRWWWKQEPDMDGELIQE